MKTVKIMDKLEKHFKHSLEQRKLSPSKNAWDKIESRLSNGDTKSKLPVKWYAVAAVFFGAVLAISLFWTSGAPTQQIQVVDTKKDSEQPINDDGTKTSFEDRKEVSRENIESESVELVLEEIPVENTSSSKMLSEPKQEVVQIADLSDGFSEEERLIIDKKVSEVFAKVALLESGDKGVTDAEIDSLLMSAQRELLTDKLFQDDGSVDAMALLDEVEVELYEAERNQLFDKLKESFFKLRTAVADRNK